MKNKFIVIEGIDGSGKSTLAASLKKDYGDACALFREPTSQSPYAIEIREILSGKKAHNEQALRELFIKDRLWDIDNNLKPSKKNNAITIVDRYYFSTAAYQGKDLEDAYSIIDYYVNNKEILQPDMVLYLRLDPDTAMSRIQKRNESTEIFEKKFRLQKIMKNYDYIFSDNFKNKYFHFPVYVLDASLKPEGLIKIVMGQISLSG